MDKLLEYDGLIYSIINKYCNRYDREDLYQVGMIGLIDAYKHYKNNKDTKFSTYAYYYILGEVNKYIRENSTLKVSRDLIELNKKIINVRGILSQKLGREPTNLEISLYLDISLELVENAIILTSEVDNIDDNYDNLKTYDNTSPDLLDLREEINKLSDDERSLIYARYYNELTQSETSNILGISQVQVSRKENKVLQKLRANL